MKVLIIEDEPATAQRLEKMLLELDSNIFIQDTIDTVEDSIDYFKNGIYPDLVFMDIHLADGNSFEIFEQVKITCPIIFTTAYDQYAIKAFKVNSIDYLLKPIKKDELAQSLKKFKDNTQPVLVDMLYVDQMMEIFKSKSEPEMKRIIVKIGQKINAVNISDIAYFQIENKIVYAVLSIGNRYPIDFSLDHLESVLNKRQFFRINRRYIITFDAILSMTSYSKSRVKIILKPPSNDDVFTSSERSGEFKNWLKGE